LNQRAKGHPSWAKVLVIVAIAGAVTFGAYLGFLEWSYDSFPVQQKPFGDFAVVTSSDFNGTEYSFQLRWLSADYVPLYAQLTSPDSDAANTPVCDTGLTSVAARQSIFMPFTITPASAGLTNVDLSIAVEPVAAGGQDFTIVYSVPTVSAQPGDITPSNAACQQPPGPPI
jgi:hypothetical protein